MASDTQKAWMWIVLTTAFLGYSLYLYSSLPVRESVFPTLADQGKALWQQHNCVACHQVYGLGGYLGPDLTNTYSQRGPEVIRALVKMGNNTMPAFDLTDQEMEALLAFMQHMDQTGVADPRSFKIRMDGTISQE